MKGLLNRKIPTLFAVILLVIGVIATTILVQRTTNLFSHAAPPETPEDIRITNISDTSFTLTYKTEARVIGTMNITNGDSGQILDDRDQQSGIPQAYVLHSITAKNLKPDTSYSFSILSGQTTFTNGTSPFSTKTGPTLSQNPTDQIPLSGRVVNPDGTRPAEALIYVTTEKGQVLSTLLKQAGIYIIPLNLLRKSDLSDLLSLSQDSKLQVLVKSADNSSQVLVMPNDINPVPAITLSQDYDFTVSTTPIASTEATAAKFPSFPSDTSIQATPQILTPKAQESFSDTQPVFNGTALPNGAVTITIHSTAQTTQVTADASGKWNYRPTQPLDPGQHTITITTADKFGILHTIEQTFTVYAAGSQVNQSATPSGKLATPTPTTAVQKTGVTPTATPTPTITSTQTKGGLSQTSPTITPRPTLPPTGSNSIMVTALTGIATTIVGIVLFIATRGASL